MSSDFEVMQEENTGKELNTWYVYDFINEDVLNNEWFETEKEAQDYLDAWIFDQKANNEMGV